MNNFLQVAVGGAVGATARYGVTILAGRLTTLPLGTLAVNVAGGLAMGLLVALLARTAGQAGQVHRLLVLGTGGHPEILIELEGDIATINGASQL